MKRITTTKEQKVKVESVVQWPKCQFCGFCHAPDVSACPRIKSFDANFGAYAKPDRK